mgnify:CR=1 FL=1
MLFRSTSTKPKSKKKDGIETTQEVPVETNETATTTPITEVQITEVPINNETAHINEDPNMSDTASVNENETNTSPEASITIDDMVYTESDLMTMKPSKLLDIVELEDATIAAEVQEVEDAIKVFKAEIQDAEGAIRSWQSALDKAKANLAGAEDRRPNVRHLAYRVAVERGYHPDDRALPVAEGEAQAPEEQKAKRTRGPNVDREGLVLAAFTSAEEAESGVEIGTLQSRIKAAGHTGDLSRRGFFDRMCVVSDANKQGRKADAAVLVVTDYNAQGQSSKYGLTERVRAARFSAPASQE